MVMQISNVVKFLSSWPMPLALPLSLSLKGFATHARQPCQVWVYKWVLVHAV